MIRLGFRPLVACLQAVFLIGLWGGLSTLAAAPRVALIIGNSTYQEISPLKNPGNDAALMARTLKGLGFQVIEERDADIRAMARAIRTFGKQLRQAGPEAVGLFFYAGHGVQARGANYLIPLGALIETEADLDIEAMSAADVLVQMEDAGNALNIVILDACRNNPFRSVFRSSTRGLARMDAPSGSLLAFSAGPGQVAFDGQKNNSPYTAALARAMLQPGLSVEQVFKSVRRKVEATTGSQQTPWEESSLKGDFYFHSAPTQVNSSTTAQQPQNSAVENAETVFWQSIADSDDPALYQAYLSQFPNGFFAPIARIKAGTLESEGSASESEATQSAALPRTFEGTWSGRTPSGFRVQVTVTGNKGEGTLRRMNSNGVINFTIAKDGQVTGRADVSTGWQMKKINLSGVFPDLYLGTKSSSGSGELRLSPD